MPGRRFEDGANVMGRWPGSTLYYEVQIMSYDGPTQLYTVRYKDGTELEIKDGDIKGLIKQKITSQEEEYVKSEKIVEEQVKSEKAVEERVISEKVLRYKRVKDHNVGKENDNIEVIAKPKPAEETGLEFGGTIGAFFGMLYMPLFLYHLLYQSAQKKVDLFHFYPHWTLPDLWDPIVFGYFSLWLLLHALFYLLPVGKVAYNVLLSSGNRLRYRSNGLHALLLTSVSVAVLVYYKVRLLYLYEHYHQFAATATLFSVLLSIYAFARSYKVPEEELSVAGKSGTIIYAFFMGRELNPRIGNFDLKYFAIHAALIGWVFVNFVMLLAEMDVQKLEQPSVSMILVNSFQLLYVLHFLWYEESILTSLEITHDGFGFMLAFGYLVWLPFVYSLQAVYLVRHPVGLSYAAVAAITTLHALGYLLFRQANNQKFAFRQNPDNPKLSYLKTIPTAAGSKLIVSGLWGVVRHPNYLGDLMIGWAWCLPCGFHSMLPYFYGFFLTGLLLHRVIRVEQQCRIKYGSDWQKYCQRVPYRLIPYLY